MQTCSQTLDSESAKVNVNGSQSVTQVRLNRSANKESASGQVSTHYLFIESIKVSSGHV